MTGGVITTSGTIGCSSCLTSNSGDWAGTWQTFSPSHFLTDLQGGLNAILGNSTTTNATTTRLAVTGSATTTFVGGIISPCFATSTGQPCIVPGTGGGGGGTVTSVGLTTPTGLSISGSPITTSGTLGLTLTSGYNIPLTASTTNWNTAFASTSVLSGTSPVTYNASTGAIGCSTCNTSSATVSSVGVSSTNSTLTIGSTPVTTSGTITADLNLANANTWTGGQTFGNATSTNLAVTNIASTSQLVVSSTSTLNGNTILGQNVTSYNGFNTLGLNTIVAKGKILASTTIGTVFTYTTPASDGLYQFLGTLLYNTSTTTTQYQVDITDINGYSITFSSSIFGPGFSESSASFPLPIKGNTTVTVRIGFPNSSGTVTGYWAYATLARLTNI